MTYINNSTVNTPLPGPFHVYGPFIQCLIQNPTHMYFNIFSVEKFETQLLVLSLTYLQLEGTKFLRGGRLLT